MSYKLKDKRERNKRLYQFKLDHPDMTSRAIGRIFHLSHVRVLAILKKQGVENETY